MAASWERVKSGFSTRSAAVVRSFSGSSASIPRCSSVRMAITCSMAASTALSRLAASQFTRRFTPPTSAFSALAFISSMAASGAPIWIKKPSMASLCLKYVM